jgi:flavodoxin I
MKVLVAYYTQTGNTERVARAIHDSLTTQKEILPVAEVKNRNGYDLIFCGFPVQMHSVPGKMADFIKALPKGQKVAFFATHGSLRGGPLPRQAFEGATALAINQKILGKFGCRGKVDAKIIDALMKKPEHKAWAEMAQSAEGHPDAADLKDARLFAQEMIDWAVG